MEFLNKHKNTISVLVAVVACLVLAYFINKKITTLTNDVQQLQRLQRQPPQSATVVEDFIYSNAIPIISTVQVDNFLQSQEVTIEDITEQEENTTDTEADLDQELDEELKKLNLNQID